MSYKNCTSVALNEQHLYVSYKDETSDPYDLKSLAFIAGAILSCLPKNQNFTIQCLNVKGFERWSSEISPCKIFQIEEIPYEEKNIYSRNQSKVQPVV